MSKLNIAVRKAVRPPYTQARRLPGAVFFPATHNSKLAPQGKEAAPGCKRKSRPYPKGPICSATYVSIRSTCPDSCGFKGNGCYVTEGFTHRTNQILDDADVTGLEAIVNETTLIMGAFKSRNHIVPQDGYRKRGRDLRLHVGGDCPDRELAMELGNIANWWKARKGGDVWTYTHNWRDIPRDCWGTNISVLASVENVDDFFLATRQGYVPALTVQEFPNNKKFKLDHWKVYPCPAETRGATCVECRLCLDVATRWRTRHAIAFAVHGRGATKIKKKLHVIKEEPCPQKSTTPAQTAAASI